MSDSQCGCNCCPNQRNGEIIAAQVLSIVAWVVPFYPSYFLVWFGDAWFEFGVMWVALILMIFYQVLWCVSNPKKLHWALIVSNLIISGCNFYSAVVWAFGLYFPMLSLVYWVPAVLWLVAAILELVFVFKKIEVREITEDADNVDAGEDV